MRSLTLKFGGSSMCLNGFKTILSRLLINSDEFDKIFIVVSAIKETKGKYTRNKNKT